MSISEPRRVKRLLKRTAKLLDPSNVARANDVKRFKLSEDKVAIVSAWWQRVRDLTRRAVERWGHSVAVGHTDLGGNLDIQAAAARVLEARALLGGAQSDRWPTIEVGGVASRSKTSLSSFGGTGSIYRNYFDASLTFQYELDLWGRLARAEEGALRLVGGGIASAGPVEARLRVEAGPTARPVPSCCR